VRILHVARVCNDVKLVLNYETKLPRTPTAAFGLILAFALGVLLLPGVVAIWVHGSKAPPQLIQDVWVHIGLAGLIGAITTIILSFVGFNLDGRYDVRRERFGWIFALGFEELLVFAAVLIST
jgi:hypothetical protein